MLQDAVASEAFRIFRSSTMIVTDSVRVGRSAGGVNSASVAVAQPTACTAHGDKPVSWVHLQTEMLSKPKPRKYLLRAASHTEVSVSLLKKINAENSLISVTTDCTGLKGLTTFLFLL